MTVVKERKLVIQEDGKRRKHLHSKLAYRTFIAKGALEGPNPYARESRELFAFIPCIYTQSLLVKVRKWNGEP